LDDPNSSLPLGWKAFGRKRRGQKAKNQIIQVRPHGRGAIQKWLFLTLSKVFSSIWGKLCAEGSSWRSIWKSLRSKGIGP